MTDTTHGSPADTAKREAQSIGDEIREKGAEAAQSARDTARSYAEQARSQAYAQGEHYRDYAADETGKVAEALRRASQDLSSGSPQERFVGQIADGVADAADRMRGMSLNDIARDTSTFARTHPAAFLGGAALIGFAAARFLKASSRDEDDEDELYLPPATRAPAPAAAVRPAPGASPSSEPIPAPATTTPPTTAS